MIERTENFEVSPARIHADPLLTIVVPIHNEEDNVTTLLEELLSSLIEVISHEIVLVDDSSTDNSAILIAELCETHNNVKAVYHPKRRGQSAAVLSGALAAKSKLIATIDGDGQNDPADIVVLLDAYSANIGEDEKLLVSGWRKNRNDKMLKKLASKIANAVRSYVLSDTTPDTGCGLKLFRRCDFIEFPAFDHMHRFLPALMIQNGGRVISVEVQHRPRKFGRSKYGILDRLWVGIIDLFGVYWLSKRNINSGLAQVKTNDSKELRG